MVRELDLAAADAIPPGQCRGFSVAAGEQTLELFVVNHQGRLYAFENRCPHTGVNLNWQPDQFLDYENAFIQCTMHGAKFRVDDGLCLRGPCQGMSLQTLSLHVHDGRIWLEMAPEGAD